MRLFFGVSLDTATAGVVGEAVRGFPVPDPPWRWIPQENYHLTLKFLGETDDRLISGIAETAARAAAGAEAFDIGFGAFGAFPSLSRPRVLFYRIESGAGRLAELARRIDEAVAPLGFESERRAFKAHLTLARIKRPASRSVIDALRSIPPLPDGTVQAVGSFELIRSHLGRGGARYECVSRFELGGRR